MILLTYIADESTQKFIHEYHIRYRLSVEFNLKNSIKINNDSDKTENSICIEMK